MKFRAPLKITSRTSSITNSFVQAIIPSVSYTAAEKSEALEQLGMTDNELSCVYCGASTTDWDHLRPLVKGKMPTGYISEIRNLVPACGPCNQSKGGSDWKVWMSGDAKGSPKSKSVSNVQGRIAQLEKFVAWGNVSPIPMADLVPPELWQEYWDQLAAIKELMRLAQEKAQEVAAHIAKARKPNARIESTN